MTLVAAIRLRDLRNSTLRSRRMSGHLDHPTGEGGAGGSGRPRSITSGRNCSSPSLDSQGVIALASGASGRSSLVDMRPRTILSTSRSPSLVIPAINPTMATVAACTLTVEGDCGSTVPPPSDNDLPGRCEDCCNEAGEIKEKGALNIDGAQTQGLPDPVDTAALGSASRKNHSTSTKPTRAFWGRVTRVTLWGGGVRRGASGNSDWKEMWWGKAIVYLFLGEQGEGSMLRRAVRRFR